MYELFTLSRRNDEIAGELADAAAAGRASTSPSLAAKQDEGVVRLGDDAEAVAGVLLALADGARAALPHRARASIRVRRSRPRSPRARADRRRALSAPAPRRSNVAAASFGERHSARRRRSSSSPSSSIAMRSCSSVSRSRSVTVLSSSVWWST